jgi:hypothetical protein
MSTQLQQIERWGLFELALEGPAEGNPFLDVEFRAHFQYQHRVIPVDGFYDGQGTYRVRFMPDVEGDWCYETVSNAPALAGHTGSLTCVAPSAGNHGPVRVRDTFHLEYADGSPYWQIGTTCYAWAHQGDELEEQTLRTLAEAPFNKMRMCVFPKHYTYNQNEPVTYPFEGKPLRDWDWTRFDPAFWQHFERRVADLCALGIEADLILFHGYDRWGFSDMGAEADDRYIRYAVARLSAYRNVWWSLANEFDLMKAKSMADWDRFFRIIQESDPYGHLRSVHNCRGFYDYGRPWVTHCSIQHNDVEKVDAWRHDYRKPVVIDECKYEGNVPQRWGCIPGQEMTRRFWEGTVRGGYVGHGDTFLHPEDILWWSKGGVLHGESPARIAFLRRILEEGPVKGFDPVNGVVENRFPCVVRGDSAGEQEYLTYFGIQQPGRVPICVDEEATFEVDVLDTWEMTSQTLPGAFSGRFNVPLPGKPYMAVRLRRVG